MQRTNERASGPARKPSTRAEAAAPGARKLLRQDHEAVSALFERYEKLTKRGTDARKGEVARKICSELTVHATIEEEIFYPALREQDPDAEDLLDEADVEHAGMKDLIAQIESSSPSDDHFDAKVKVLGEYVQHHVKEEQNEIFPAARAAALDLKALGEALAARKAELKA
jgi:hemerythrin superfamily protein